MVIAISRYCVGSKLQKPTLKLNKLANLGCEFNEPCNK